MRGDLAHDCRFSGQLLDRESRSIARPELTDDCEQLFSDLVLSSRVERNVYDEVRMYVNIYLLLRLARTKYVFLRGFQ